MADPAIRAAIKRATLTAQKEMDFLDAESLKNVEELYRHAAEDIGAQIKIYSSVDGNVQLAQLRDLLAQVQGRLDDLAKQREALLQDSMAQASYLGVRPMTAEGVTEAIKNPVTFPIGGADVLSAPAAMKISDDALNFVRTFVASDGLQLSDRIWRLDRHARDAVVNAIEMAVIQGHGAGQSAREFLARGETIPYDIADKLKSSNAGAIVKTVSGVLTGKGSPMDNAMRLFRTELNRAHGEAYIKGALDHPDAAGVRFLLSPSHPEPDICDLLARQNLYGLGPGVYPSREKCPWPAHPNTLSYLEVVFQDEVTKEDKQGKETPMQALGRLTPEQRKGALGANKTDAYDAGLLSQGMIRSPWKSVQKRIGPLLQQPKPPALPKKALPKTLDDMIGLGSGIGDDLIKMASGMPGGFRDNFPELLFNELGKARPTSTPVKVEGGGKGAELVRAASKLFPDDWTKAADKYGRLFARASRARGWQISYLPESAGILRQVTGFGKREIRGGDGFISAGGFSTAVHEFSHRLQHAIPELDDYFQDMHERRTKGDPLKRLKDLFPGHGYAIKEVTREDKYINPYQGKEYSGYSYLGKHGALEVMTMAFEDVLGGNPLRLEKVIQHDREMFNLVIGLLFHYVP